MSVTLVGATRDVRARVNYLLHGDGSKDDDRVAYIRCDVGTPDEDVEERARDFVNIARGLTRGRQVQAQTYIQSFPRDEFDKDSEADVERANGLGYELARFMHGDSVLVMVVTHIDGKSGCVHNHIVTINHDLETGHALTDYRVHWQVREANDELMRDEGLSTIPRREDTWEANRERFEDGSFQRRIGDMVSEIMLDREDSDEFFERLDGAGIDLRVKQREDKKTGEVVTGWTYAAKLEGESRLRRCKASTLAKELTCEGVGSYFDHKEAERVAQREKEDAARREAEERERRKRKKAEREARDEEAREKIAREQEARERVRRRVKEREREQREKEAREKAEAASTRKVDKVPVSEVVDTPQQTPRTNYLDTPLFDTYAVDKSDVALSLSTLKSERMKQLRDAGMAFRTDGIYSKLSDASNNVDATTARLQREVDEARNEFYRDKKKAEEAKRATPGSFGLIKRTLESVASNSKDLVDRLISRMFAEMFARLIEMRMRERIDRDREEAEQRLYESRGRMWDAEKRLAAAKKAIAAEDARTPQSRLKGKTVQDGLKFDQQLKQKLYGEDYGL